MNEISADDDEHDAPGELIAAVADGLSSHGFHVALPDGPEGRELTITNVPDVSYWRLRVGDDGHVEWDYPAPEIGEPDSKRVADIVITMLTGNAGPHERLGGACNNPTITFKGIVGLEFKERGFSVLLDVIEDYADFTVTAEIYVTRTGSNVVPAVYVNGGGEITWINEYALRDGTEAIVRDIVETITRAAGMTDPCATRDEDRR
jgi:hypothetical protein